MTVTLVPTASLSLDNVPRRAGRPTKEELLVYYPAQFTWIQLKTFVNSGDLGLLKRHKKLQARFDEWVEGIKAEYGSSAKYLLDYRLQWGKRDTLALLTSSVDPDGPQIDSPMPSQRWSDAKSEAGLPPLVDNAPKYFIRNTPSEYLSIIQNDWPYSVPPDVEHTLIWTRLPIFHKDIVANDIAARVEQDGLWGFTGNSSPPPSPSILPSYLPALADWGVTMDKLVRSVSPTEEEAVLIYRAGEEIHEFVKNRWEESKWETAWFVNPPVRCLFLKIVLSLELNALEQRLQSVPDLAHIHVFARPKLP